MFNYRGLVKRFDVVMKQYCDDLIGAYHHVMKDALFQRVLEARNALVNRQSFINQARMNRTDTSYVISSFFIAVGTDAHIELLENGAALLTNPVLAPGFCLTRQAPEGNDEYYASWVDPNLAEFVHLVTEFALFAIQPIPMAMVESLIPGLIHYTGPPLEFVSFDHISPFARRVPGTLEERKRWVNLYMLALVTSKARQRTTRELDKAVFRKLGIKVPDDYYPSEPAEFGQLVVPEVEHSYITTVGDPMHGLSIPERLELASSWHKRCIISEGHQTNFMNSLVNTSFGRQHLNAVLTP